MPRFESSFFIIHAVTRVLNLILITLCNTDYLHRKAYCYIFISWGKNQEVDESFAVHKFYVIFEKNESKRNTAFHYKVLISELLYKKFTINT